MFNSGDLSIPPPKFIPAFSFLGGPYLTVSKDSLGSPGTQISSGVLQCNSILLYHFHKIYQSHQFFSTSKSKCML